MDIEQQFKQLVVKLNLYFAGECQKIQAQKDKPQTWEYKIFDFSRLTTTCSN